MDDRSTVAFSKTVFNVINTAVFDHYLNHFSNAIASNEDLSSDDPEMELGNQITYTVFTTSVEPSGNPLLISPSQYGFLYHGKSLDDSVYKDISHIEVSAQTGSTPPEKLQINLSIHILNGRGLFNAQFDVIRKNQERRWVFNSLHEADVISNVDEETVELALNEFVIEHLDAGLSS